MRHVANNLLAVGPNFKLAGNVKGSLTVAANFQATVNIAQWDIRQTYPTANNDWEPQSRKTPNRDGTQELFSPEFSYGVQATGSIEAHVMPIVSFGIEFGSKLSSATATINLVADGRITFNAQATVGSTTSFCYGIDAGAQLYATIQAPEFPGWTLPQQKFQLAETPAIQIVPFNCPISSRDVKPDMYLVNGTIPSIDSPSLPPRSALEKRAKIYGPLYRIPKVSCPNSGGLGGDPGDCLFCDHSDPVEPVEKRDVLKKRDGPTCSRQDLRSDESTCDDSIASKRDLAALLDGFSMNSSSADEYNQHFNGLEKRTQKFLDWTVRGLTVPLDFGNYPSCNQAASSQASKWYGFEAVSTPANTCPTQITKFTAAQKAGPYQTDHVFEVQLVTRFLDMLRGNTQYPNSVRLPPGYAAASDDWVSGKLLVSRVLELRLEMPY
jgi:chitinase